MENIPWWYTKVDGEEEKHALFSAFGSRHFSCGPVTKDLEKRLAHTLGIPYVVMTLNGTSALTMALLAAGVKAGDEVIVPDLTWIATAQAASVLGARVVLVDCEKEVPLMDVEEVKKRITKRTKAIIPVHLNGRACDLDRVLPLARTHGIAVIEDCCKALASKKQGKCLGSFGDIGCFSLGMISPISSGYGGFVATKDEQLYRRLMLIRDHGVRRDAKEAYELQGFNFKISDLLSSIGLAQLSRIEQKKEHLKNVYATYTKGLAGHKYLRMMPVKVEEGEISLLVDIKSGHREGIIPYLKENGIGTERFHLPLHKASYLGSKGQFPNATEFSAEGFVLPSGPSQPLENVEKCIMVLNKWKPESTQGTPPR